MFTSHKMSHVLFVCKLVPPLLKNHFFTMCQPILQIIDKIRCIDPCNEADHNTLIVDMITCVYDSLICKLEPSLLRSLFFTLSRPTLHITAQIRCPDPCVQGQ